MTSSQAEQIWDVLVAEVKVYSDQAGNDRRSFVSRMTAGDCTEWRIQGELGFGGKFRPSRWTVDCYREDITPERAQIIERTNRRLAELLAQTGGA